MKLCSLRKSLALLLLTTGLLTSAGCTASDGNKRFGADSDYFIGLSLLEKGKQKEAIVKFSKCAKNGSYFCARKSAEKLCEFGNLQEKNKACLNLLKKYNDSDALRIAVKQLSLSKEISKVVEITNGINLAKEDNETIKLRMEALQKISSASLENELSEWYTKREISNEHYQFYRDSLLQTFPKEDALFENPNAFLITYRIELYKRNYPFAFSNATKIIEFLDEGKIPLETQIASDIGKACLYGSSDFYKNAVFFKELANRYKGSKLEFYFWFYAGRLFDKAGTYQSLTGSSFKAAIASAQSDSQKDNALWYLFDTSLNLSVDSILERIKEYSGQWSNPLYFEDFFEKLATSLLAAGRWDSFCQLYKNIDGKASDATVAQFAYIYARLLQEGLAVTSDNSEKKSQEIEKAFLRALESGDKPYYKLLAANQLKLSDDEIRQIIGEPFAPIKKNLMNQPERKINRDAEIVLDGYAFYGFPDLIYPFWKLHFEEISEEKAFDMADFLRSCSTGQDDYYSQSLRIASKAIYQTKRNLTDDELKLIYPDNYRKEIENECSKYEMEPYYMFALVRTESFFDPDIQSSAGAVGLTQLMELTGGDIARRLHYSEYSLEDAQTNIEFGTYYLAQLISRCDNSYLQAFFSYNAGITRVRRWLKSSLVEFGKRDKLPMDLFLESIPYAETRNYGRKLVADGIMYEYLYNQNRTNSFNEMVEKALY